MAHIALAVLLNVGACGAAFSAEEPLQEAIMGEDECRESGDCSLSALQHKAMKVEFGDSQNHEELEGDFDNQTFFSNLLDVGGDTSDEKWNQLTRANAAPSAIAVIDEVNRLFDSDNNGVYQRLVYGTVYQPWIPHGASTSFALMNKASWDPIKQEITVFHYHGPASGFIAKPSGIAQPGMVKCLFPCDGFSDHRTIGSPGCGCGTAMTCTQGTTDWCDGYGNLKNFQFRGKGFPTPCAYKPDETAQMLKMYTLVKEQKAPPGIQYSCMAWGQGTGAAAWNEAVVDSSMWKKDAGGNVIAVVLTSTCYASTICRNNFGAWYGRFKMSHGWRPMVYMDLKKRVSPYSLICDQYRCRDPKR